ncbi:unnamed protein product [Closterium sp. Naga37s-1]|nr:unnamed protein product [Closterium sp. Naga37s-1]
MLPTLLPPSLSPQQKQLQALNSVDEYAEAMLNGTVVGVVDERPFLDLILSQDCTFTTGEADISTLGWAFVSGRHPPTHPCVVAVSELVKGRASWTSVPSSTSFSHLQHRGSTHFHPRMGLCECVALGKRCVCAICKARDLLQPSPTFSNLLQPPPTFFNPLQHSSTPSNLLHPSPTFFIPLQPSSRFLPLLNQPCTPRIHQAFQKGSNLAVDLSKAIAQLSETGQLRTIHSNYVPVSGYGLAVSMGAPVSVYGLNNLTCSGDASGGSSESLGAEGFQNLFILYGVMATFACLMYLAVLLYRGHLAKKELEEEGEEVSGGMSAIKAKPWMNPFKHVIYLYNLVSACTPAVMHATLHALMHVVLHGLMHIVLHALMHVVLHVLMHIVLHVLMHIVLHVRMHIVLHALMHVVLHVLMHIVLHVLMHIVLHALMHIVLHALMHIVLHALMHIVLHVLMHIVLHVLMHIVLHVLMHIVLHVLMHIVLHVLMHIVLHVRMHIVLHVLMHIVLHALMHIVLHALMHIVLHALMHIVLHALMHIVLHVLMHIVLHALMHIVLHVLMHIVLHVLMHIVLHALMHIVLHALMHIVLHGRMHIVLHVLMHIVLHVLMHIVLHVLMHIVLHALMHIVLHVLMHIVLHVLMHIVLHVLMHIVLHVLMHIVLHVLMHIVLHVLMHIVLHVLMHIVLHVLMHIVLHALIRVPTAASRDRLLSYFRNTQPPCLSHDMAADGDRKEKGKGKGIKVSKKTAAVKPKKQDREGQHSKPSDDDSRPRGKQSEGGSRPRGNRNEEGSLPRGGSRDAAAGEILPARLLPSQIKNKQKRSAVTAKLRAEKEKGKKQRLKRRRQDEERAVALGEAVGGGERWLGLKAQVGGSSKIGVRGRQYPLSRRHCEPCLNLKPSQAPPRKAARTIDSTREVDETIAQPDDDELHADEAQDEFAPHFNRERPPKVLITTCQRIHQAMKQLIKELLVVIPGSEYYERRQYRIKEIVQYASARDYTAVIVINENRSKPNALMLIGLPEGPTALFKLSSLVLRKDIKNAGRATGHLPELILNNFSTRLGHRVGRLLASLFPQDPEFKGRRVVTLHNQRDFIFFRHHRYIFEDPESRDESLGLRKKKAREEKERAGMLKRKKAAEAAAAGKKTGSVGASLGIFTRLQECGPRFTLKLMSVQRGTFDSKGGEYEWVYKNDMDTSRRRFFL